MSAAKSFKGDKGRPWVRKNGTVDYSGIQDGKWDDHLHKFKARDSGGYKPEEWKKLHPMVKRKIYLKNHGVGGTGKRSPDKVETLKDMNKFKNSKIVSLKRKLKRETNCRKRIVAGEFDLSS